LLGFGQRAAAIMVASGSNGGGGTPGSTAPRAAANTGRSAVAGGAGATSALDGALDQRAGALVDRRLPAASSALSSTSRWA
jgi:hypothetical protein